MSKVIPQYMSRSQLADFYGMSKRGIEEAILQTLADGHYIRIKRPPSPKGKGHPRYNLADLERAWTYEHPLAVA